MRSLLKDSHHAVYSQVVLGDPVFLEDLFFLVFPGNKRETDHKYCDAFFCF